MASCAKATRLGNGEPLAAQFVVLSVVGLDSRTIADRNYIYFLMMQCSTSSNDKIPVQNLPYNFKNRLANLSSVKDVQNLRQTCREFRKLCRRRPKWFDQVYITDNDTVFQWASQRRIIFQIFKWIYIIFRFVTDQNYSFHPTWQTVLDIYDIVDYKKPIYVTDTLVLHCQSMDAFEKLIPYICGPFTRLTIHGGSINLDQLQRLIGKNVNLIKITSNLDVEPDQYDDFVELVKEHTNSWRDKFTVSSGTPALWSKVCNAFEHHRTHRIYNDSHIVHQNYVLVCMVYVSIFSFVCTHMLLTEIAFGVLLTRVLYYTVFCPFVIGQFGFIVFIVGFVRQSKP